jgi:hypothetical protein
MIHSIILYWMPMYAYFGDVIWSNGRDGGYLVLGNMVYTVMSCEFDCWKCIISNVFLIAVCRRNRLPQSRSNYKLMDMAYALFYLGINRLMVRLYVDL